MAQHSRERRQKELPLEGYLQQYNWNSFHIDQRGKYESQHGRLKFDKYGGCSNNSQLSAFTSLIPKTLYWVEDYLGE